MAQPVEQHAGGSDAHSLGRHDCQIVAFSQPLGREQWAETFLLDEQHSAEAVLGPIGRVEDTSIDSHHICGLGPQAQISSDFQRAEWRFMSSVWLGEMAAGVPDDIPIPALRWV